MRRSKARGRGTWAELIFFCLMLGGVYFILALSGVSWIGERGRAAGEYLRTRWGGAVIVPLLFWIYLCFARLSRERVPRLIGQFLGTLQLYFSLNFIYGLVQYAGWRTNFALFLPSTSGINAARFFVLNFGALGAIVSAVLFLLIAAFLLHSRMLLNLMPYIIALLQKFNAQLNAADDESSNERAARERERERERERRERERIEREREELERIEREEMELENQEIERREREKMYLEQREIEQKELERRKLKRLERLARRRNYDNDYNYDEDEKHEEYEEYEVKDAGRADYDNYDNAVRGEHVNRKYEKYENYENSEREEYDNLRASRNEPNNKNFENRKPGYENIADKNFVDKNENRNIEGRNLENVKIDGKKLEPKDKFEIVKNDVKNNVDNVNSAGNADLNKNKGGAAGILSDLLNSLEAGAFAVPDNLLRPVDDDISQDTRNTVSPNLNNNGKNLNLESNDDDNKYKYTDEDTEQYYSVNENSVNSENEISENVINQGKIIIETLKNFGVNASIANIITGSSVIQFQLALSRGVKVDRLPRFANDLAMALAVMSVRIEAPIPGKHFAGIEIPNPERRVIDIDTALESQEFKDNTLELPVLIGENIESHFVISGLEDMQHLIAAGAAGSGKSVFINNCIMSMCANNSPEKLKLILIDPKRVEFAIYDGLPHLIAAPVSDSKKAYETLAWAVKEMERRMGLFADLKVRNLTSYNNKIEPEKRLARIVIAIDEPGDLMYSVGRENNNNNLSVNDITTLLVRTGGAAGIHLIIKTQRPSMNLIAEIIKTNIPARAAFKLTSQTEARLFTGFSGAEKLQGRGDMLFISAASEYPLRLQTPFTDENRILEFIVLMRKKFGVPNYNYISPEN